MTALISNLHITIYNVNIAHNHCGYLCNTIQITFILHIQGVFSLPGRGFHQRVTLISSVPMTLDDVIVHVRQFIIALVSVDGCSSFSDPNGFLDVPESAI